MRRSAALRSLRQEVRLDARDLIYPVFVQDGLLERVPISALPGQYRYPPAQIGEIAVEASRLGLGGLLLFGIPAQKTPDGRNAALADGPVQRAIQAAKQNGPDLAVITDVCVCSYTEHGHCGVLVGNRPDDRLSSSVLGEIAVSHARAGADMVAPSAMMDGQVSAIRAALDEAGFVETPVLAYCCKFASGFYGPFREAASSTPSFGDRKGYQIPPANAQEALAEARQSEAEGADMLMVKPALPYLDIVAKVRAESALPLVAYQVSGEYAMIEAAAEKGWLDRRTAALEALVGIRRSGADRIISYYAMEVAGWLAERAGPQR